MLRRTTLALAALIVAAAMATPAHANFVSTGQADNTKISLTTTGTAKLQFSATAFFQCGDWTLTGSITPANRSTASFPVTGVVWSNCTFTLFGVSSPVTITDSGSDWTVSAGASLGGTSWAISVTTPTALSITVPTSGCTINFAKQTFAAGWDFTNSSHSLSVTVTGISFTTTTCGGFLPPSGTTASLVVSFSDKTLVVTAA